MITKFKEWLRIKILKFLNLPTEEYYLGMDLGFYDPTQIVVLVRNIKGKYELVNMKTLNSRMTNASEVKQIIAELCRQYNIDPYTSYYDMPYEAKPFFSNYTEFDFYKK